MDREIFEKFSDNLKKVLITAEKVAQEQKSYMNTEHQLLALLMVKNSLAYEILSNNQVSKDRVQLIMGLLSKSKPIVENVIGVSESSKKAIEKAVQIALKYNHHLVDCEHLLLSLLSDKSFNSFTIVEKMGISPTQITRQIEAVFKSMPPETQSQAQQPIDPEIPYETTEDEGTGPFQPGFMPGPAIATRDKRESILSAFTTDLNVLAKHHKLDPVIGRDKEINRIMQILSRRTKNNPILVGDPGVGKTAIIEGLAQRVIEGRVSEKLQGKEILSLDMGALIAGTMYRGQFESRVKKIMAEVIKRKNIIIFIDEMHTVVGAGSTEGSIDAANILKPLLSRGELRVIGSTTFDEYKKHIEKDPAFERRLQPVKISEPSVDETIKILYGIKSRYEQYHHVKYTNAALDAAARLSKRYINDRFLPDKAIDLIDEAAAAANSEISENYIELAKLKNGLHDILKQKEELIYSEQYEKATLLREKEIKIENKINTIKNKDKKQRTDRKMIDIDDIAQIVSNWTGVPITSMSLLEKKRYLDLEKRLSTFVIGQKEAIKSISEAIKQARIGLSNPNRPTGSFIFLGPTGVGKSELAKVIARELFGSSDQLIKIDMSEFMERHNVSRLVGAPAGYVGYEEGGKLTETVRKNPYSVILLDEIEKAHPEVFNILLQIMEDGTLTDAKGRKVDFKNTIIIMTSNLGSEFMKQSGRIGFESTDKEYDFEKFKENVLNSVDKHFKPEFINRLDKIIVFNPLTKEAIRKIVNLQIKELALRLKEKELKMKISNKAKDWIAKKGYSPQFGARPIRKVITDNIEQPLSNALLNEKFLADDIINIELVEDKIALK